MILSSRKGKCVTGKMASLMRSLIWCFCLAATAAAAKQHSSEPVSSVQAKVNQLTEQFQAALVEISSLKQAMAKMFESMEAQRATILEFSSSFKNQTAKTDEALSTLESAGQRFATELTDLKTQKTSVEEAMMTQTVEFEEYKANMSEIIGKNAEECQKAVEEQSHRLDVALLRFEAWKNETYTASTSQAETTIDASNVETLTSTVVTPAEFKSTVAPPSEEPSTVAPPTALQAYLSSGLAGLTGKPLNIENEHYKGEFLYLTRNPTDRSANVFYDGATLAVGRDKLRESAFQWELLPVPGESSSLFYLRNKLNELKPIPSTQDGRLNYIRIETVSPPTIGEASQLVITMKETVYNGNYYHPHSTPNLTPALNGRDILADSSRKYPATKWIVTFASETLRSTEVPPLEFSSTVASLPTDTFTTTPPTALQIYRSSGFAGLTGKPLNIENEHYNGEFLYLARNLTDRSGSLFINGATLAVGRDKLRESAFQWEFVQVPGEDSSVVYLRNKLNELKPIPSNQDGNGRFDYIRIETVSPPMVGEPSQLVITMKKTVENEYYYHPYSTPNTDSALNGREIYLNSSPSTPGRKWIVTLAS